MAVSLYDLYGQSFPQDKSVVLVKNYLPSDLTKGLVAEGLPLAEEHFQAVIGMVKEVLGTNGSRYLEQHNYGRGQVTERKVPNLVREHLFFGERESPLLRAMGELEFYHALGRQDLLDHVTLSVRLMHNSEHCLTGDVVKLFDGLCGLLGEATAVHFPGESYVGGVNLREPLRAIP